MSSGICLTNRFQLEKLQSDFVQVENQVLMEILKAMTMQLCDIHKMMPRIWEKDPQITDEEVARKMLDVVLKSHLPSPFCTSSQSRCMCEVVFWGG